MAKERGQAVPGVGGAISMRASIRTPLWAQVPPIPCLLNNNESSGTTVVRVGGKASEWILKLSTCSRLLMARFSVE